MKKRKMVRLRLATPPRKAKDGVCVTLCNVLKTTQTMKHATIQTSQRTNKQKWGCNTIWWWWLSEQHRDGYAMYASLSDKLSHKS